MSEQGFSTKAIHAGQEPDPVHGAIVTPISLSTTFAQKAPGEHGGYEYSRSGNPTRTAYETCIASLENAKYGLAFASGLAAEDALMRTVRPGKKILLGNDVYGGTYRLLYRIHAVDGRIPLTADLTALDHLAKVWDKDIALVWFETPTNPMLTLYNIQAICELAHARGALVVVDNTFATPYLQNPLAWGADAVVHSATKYIAGHSDVVGGFIGTSNSELNEKLRYLQNAVGAVPGPFDCYLALRGVKTLAVRMERHCDNGEQIVEWLGKRAEVASIMYPQVSAQMKRRGGMVSFTLKGGEPAARALVSSTKLFTLAESLGAVESLIEHPYSMTHASTVGSHFEVSPALVRMSVGIENIEDLLDDLDRAFRVLGI